MREEHLPELKKITTVSKILLPFLHFTFYLSVILLVLIPLGLMVTPTAGPDDVDYFRVVGELDLDLGDLHAGLLTLKDKVLFGAVIIPLLLASVILRSAIELTRCFKNNNIFSSTCAYHARKIARVFLVYVVFSTLFFSLLPMMSSIESLTFSALPFPKNVIILCLLWLFVWVIEIGAALNLDSEMTI